MEKITIKEKASHVLCPEFKEQVMAHLSQCETCRSGMQDFFKYFVSEFPIINWTLKKAGLSMEEYLK